jgi:hypothetical protein
VSFVILADTREPALDSGDREEALFVPRVYRAATKGRPGEYVPAPMQRVTLATGDYSLPGLEQWVAIERKSCQDLIGTLLGGRRDSVGEHVSNSERFRRELERMRAMPAGSFRCVVVEAARDDIERELYKVPADARIELTLAEEARRIYDGTFAAGAIPCEGCPGYRWPGERCNLCAATPPGELRNDGVNPVSLLHFCESLERDYLVPWVWAGGKESAERYVGGMLRGIWEQAQGHGEAFTKACKRGVAGYRPWLAKHTGEEVAA